MCKEEIATTVGNSFLDNESSLINKYDCLYQNESLRLNIQAMNSYTPQAVALMLRGSKPDEAKKTLRLTYQEFLIKLIMCNFFAIPSRIFFKEYFLNIREMDVA